MQLHFWERNFRDHILTTVAPSNAQAYHHAFHSPEHELLLLSAFPATNNGLERTPKGFLEVRTVN